jgi:hypothetical protein
VRAAVGRGRVCQEQHANFEGLARVLEFEFIYQAVRWRSVDMPGSQAAIPIGVC